MAKQIKNRREDLYINDVPPEILDETKLSADGFVKNTDFASNDAHGVIKVSASTGTSVASSGTLQGVARTLAQYDAGVQALIISKGTLENVIKSLIIRAFVAEADSSGEALDGTKWNFSLYKQTAEGGGSEYIWLVDQINP